MSRNQLISKKQLNSVEVKTLLSTSQQDASLKTHPKKNLCLSMSLNTKDSSRWSMIHLESSSCVQRMNPELENSSALRLDQLSFHSSSSMNGTNAPNLLLTTWNMRSLSIHSSFHQFAQLHPMFLIGKQVIASISPLSFAHYCVVLDMTHTLLSEPLQRTSLWKMKVSWNALSAWISMTTKIEMIQKSMMMRAWCTKKRKTDLSKSRASVLIN